MTTDAHIEMNIDADRLALTQTLQAMIIDYWHDVDMNWGRNAADYFLPDARWEGDDFCLGSNREEIRDFYTRRERQGGRVTFHAVENFRAFFDGAPVCGLARAQHAREVAHDRTLGQRGEVWRQVERRPRHDVLARDVGG